MSAPKIATLVNGLVAENFVFMASKSYCPYCNKAKSIFNSLNQKFNTVELDQVENGAEIQAYLKEFTNQGTVPNIFINKKHIGGCSDLEALQASGELQKLLASS